MSIEVDLVNVLKADVSIAAVVGARIYPEIAPQDPTYPLIIFHVISTVPVNSMDGHNNLDNVRVQINPWATTYKQAKQIELLVRNAMNNTNVFKSTCIDARGLQYEPETKLYAMSSDYSIWVRQ